MIINEIIKPNFHTVNINDPIDNVLTLMGNLNINGMPVVDDNSKLVGMVVKADIYRFMMQPGHYSSCPVEWVMSKSVITAQANEDLITVANRLRKNEIIAMPVLQDEKLVGIITIENLLDYFLTNNN
ncbi:CBS domain-containing protein [Clostridium weizhouense]|uniref:CBS domain-containing protein n=1 Tax=Clostridium weizhouense TaxID=2859781 RepID=A0ABS7AME7_9CLOT|nr:CBS domain-containing protein [Clostridium weizhouense]MBW6408871.1 CBS domain-containing protein [Clostridium weizhouense]